MGITPVIAGKAVGKRNTGQRPLGWGYTDYKDYFESQEVGEKYLSVLLTRNGCNRSSHKRGEAILLIR